jgi:hypothetical protein
MYIYIWQVLFLRVDVEGTTPPHPQRTSSGEEGQDLCASVMSETELRSINGTLPAATGKAVDGILCVYIQYYGYTMHYKSIYYPTHYCMKAME